ncbi:MAG: stage II sporulation protein M [archaeon]
MVLEALITPRLAERKPWQLFFIGIFYSTIAMFLSLWIFQEHASLVMVFLTVLACVPLMYKTMRLEEKKERINEKAIDELKEHWPALVFFVALFLGFVVSYAVWYVFLPAHLVESLFSTQASTINAINAKIHYVYTANSVTAYISGGAVFAKIFTNNIKVLFFCVFFSFFYGAGAIFILTWNASVIATAVGNFIRENLSDVFGWSYFAVFSIGFMRYMTHGIFEILAYFMGGLAGGIISVAVIRHDFSSKRFRHIIFDSFDLIILAVFTLFIAAIIEVFVTPSLF